MDLQTTLALYRTHLAERRTAMSQVQLGFVLVTVPVTLHAGFMMLAERHAEVRSALLSLPVMALGMLAVVAGMGCLAFGVRDLLANAGQLRAIKRHLEAELTRDASAPGGS